MRFVVQRVTHASVTVDSQVIGKIGNGFMVLIGVADTDTREIADEMVKSCWDFAFLRMRTARRIWIYIRWKVNFC